MREFMAVTKALADENRVRALMLLTHGQLCLCQIIEMLGLAPSTVSKHMAVLRQAELVEVRKRGRWRYYRLAGPGASAAVRQGISWLSKVLAKDRQILKDAKRLRAVRKMDVEELCKHYKS